MAKQIPQATTARILPKTLFGERYVDLQLPAAGGPGLQNGDVIATDKSGNAQELQQLFDKLLPVLQAIPPQDLNVTLTSLSQALQGRGEELGTTIDNLNKVFVGINGVLPDLQGTCGAWRVSRRPTPRRCPTSSTPSTTSAPRRTPSWSGKVTCGR